MRKITRYCCLLSLILCFGQRAFAQGDAKTQDTPKSQEAAKADDTPAHYYHLSFVVQELGLDGKPVNSRSYTTTISTGKHEDASIRSDSRVPVSIAPNQFQYQNIGINIDERDAHEVGRQLALNVIADVTTFGGTTDESHQAVMRTNKWQAAILIPIGKPTVVFTSDTLDSKGSMQLVVTATPVQ